MSTLNTIGKALPDFLNFTRKRRAPMDERIPDGSSVVEAGMGVESDATAQDQPNSPEVDFQPSAPPSRNPWMDVFNPATKSSEVDATATPPVVAPTVPNAIVPAGLPGTVENPTEGTRLQQIEAERNTLAAQRNPDDKDGRWWTALKEAGLGFVGGGLMGALTGGLRGAIAPNVNERRARDGEVKRLDREAARERQSTTWQQQLKLQESQINENNAQAQERRARPHMEADKTAARAKDQKARALVSIFRNLPEFDPNDAENADLVAQLKDAGLPVVAKKRGQQLKFIQDPKTGAWDVIAGDKATGTATSSNVTTAGGGQLVTASAQKMVDDFRRTKMYSDIRERTKDRASREGIAAANRNAANGRAAAGIASAEKRALAGRRFNLGRLAIQAEKEGKSLESLVKEIQSLDGEVYDENE